MLSIFALDILLLLLLLLIGTPLPYCFGAALIFMVIFADIPINSLMLWGFNQMIGPVLLAGPLFILVGSLIAESGIAPRLLNAINLFIGKVKGAIGILVIFACGLLGAISGSSFTGIAAVGPIMIPQMMAQGFSRGYATSLVSVSSILGVLIPPSVPLIIYGWVTGTSVLGSFLSTVGPGILVMITFSIINVVYSRKNLIANPEIASALENPIDMEPVEKKKHLRIIISAIPGILMPVLILGGIYGGIFTPTEAAAVAGVGFDQFHQDAAGVLRVNEVDARVGRTASGSVVQQPNAALAKLGGDGVDVGDPVGELLQSGAASVDELGDGRVLVQWCEQLNGSGSGGGADDGEHGFAHALRFVDFLVGRHHAQVLRVPRDCRVEIGHRDSDVIDRDDEVGRQRCECRTGGGLCHTFHGSATV